MSKPYSDSIARITLYLLWALAGLLALEMIVSLRWRIFHDTPILYYVALLIEKYNLVPYRDIFETSFPGTLMVFYGINGILGHTDLAFRLLDISLLIFLLLISARLVKPFGPKIGIAASILFGLTYLGYGPALSMQREYLALIPIAVAFCIASSEWKTSSYLKPLITGACFGLSSSIKPQLILCALPLFVYLAHCQQTDNSSLRDLLKSTLRMGLMGIPGFMITFSLPFLWVWHLGGLPAFFEMLTEYMPLYLQLNGEHEQLSTTQRAAYVLKQWRLGHGGFWMASILGVYVALEKFGGDRKKRALILLLLAELLIGSLLPALAGQFWIYHWLLFLWFACLCAAFLFISVFDIQQDLVKRICCLSIFLLFMAMTLRPQGGDILATLQNRPLPPIKEGRVDLAADFMRERLQPGDTIQSLDSTSGGVHSLLLLEAKLASPFLCDFYFYHNSANPFVQKIRERFMQSLGASNPRFILDSEAKPKVHGQGLQRQFAEFDDWLARHYHPALRSGDLTIYERND